MKRIFLLIVVSALLVALGFAQTPAASVNTDQTTIKGCLGGSDGNYTVLEGNTGHIFKITTSSVDLKPHLGHDVTLIGHEASGMSSNAANNSFSVTEVTMISERCAAAAAAVAPAPTATVSTPSETTSTAAAAGNAPAATISTPAETAVTPAVVATPAAEAAVTPAVVATPAAEAAVTPAAAPAATVSTPSGTAPTPAAAAAQTTRPPARPRKLSATPAAAVTTPSVTASTSSEPVSTPGAATYTPAETANTSPEGVSTPAPAATKPTATVKGGSFWLLIPFAVLVIVIGTLVPFLSKWRKQKTLERTGDQNLSFTHEVSSDPDKDDRPRKAA